MAELSHCNDVHTLDSHMLPRAGGPDCATSAEAELRHLFHQLTSDGNISGDLFLGSELVRADQSELFACWVRRLYAQVITDGKKREDGKEVIDAYDRWLPFCPDMRRRIKKLVRILVAADSTGTEEPVKFALVRGRESLQNVLLILKRVAADPCGKEGPNEELKDQIVRARKAIFLRAEDISIPDMEEFPYRSRKRRARICPSEESTGIEGEMLNQPKRRSQRTLELLKIGDSHLPRMRIPVGSSFQADVPDWTGPSNNFCSDDNIDVDDSRWVGTLVWPAEEYSIQKYEGNIGKGGATIRCYCTHQGSVECIRSHVSSARLQLKSYLGSIFASWGFDEMGEGVSKTWTSEEQENFDDIVRLYPLSQNKSFLEPATKFFSSKSKKDIVSYYFNVYILRRMSNQTRLLLGTIDSDDDEGDGKTFDLGRYKYVRIPEVSFSLSSQSRCIGWIS